MSMMDGVTTGLDLELGALNIAAWYECEAGKWPMNYGQAVSHEMARMKVHDGLVLDDPIDAVNIFDLRAASVKYDASRVRVLVVPTNEEKTIARDVIRVLNGIMPEFTPPETIT